MLQDREQPAFMPNPLPAVDRSAIIGSRPFTAAR
jgi:hypothetical protein